MQPVISPKTVANPNFLPCTTLCVSTKILSGPGEQAKAKVAKQNENKISKCIYLFIILKNRY
jgi:hypothetical protein